MILRQVQTFAFLFSPRRAPPAARHPYRASVRDRSFRDDRQAHQPIAPAHDRRHDISGQACDKPACGACVRASGLIYRSQATRTEKRYAVTAPPRIARLNGGGPFRVHRPGRKVERRAVVEFKLRRSIMVARRFGVEEFEKRVKE